MNTKMDPRIAAQALNFLQRCTLQGSEVATFCVVANALQAIVQQTDTESADSKATETE